MATGIRLFHSRVTLNNYVLVKPTENKAFLYKLNKDGTLPTKPKPLLKKTYGEYIISRKAYFPSSESFVDTPHRYHKWESKMPRKINKIPNNLSQMFSIKNKDGMRGSVVEVVGAIDNKGKISSVNKLKFPLEGYDHYGITNLARIFLKKVFNMYSKTPPNKNTYYVDKKLDKTLNNLDKEYNVPKFETTPVIKQSMKQLCKKHKMRISNIT